MPQQKQTERGSLYQQPSPLIYALHHAPVSGLSWSPDGTKLVSADEQGEIHVWDANMGTSLFSCNAQVSHVTCLVWSPNGEKIAIADDEGQVALCDGANGNLMMKYNEHRAAISTLAWSPDSTMIVSSDRDTVHVWRVDNSEIC